MGKERETVVLGGEIEVEFITVKCNKINRNLLRLDAEHHVGIDKINLKQLQGKNLSTLCSKIVQGPNPKFLDDGIPSLNGKNIYLGTLDAGEPNYISEEEYFSFKAYHLQRNDLLITLKHASRIGRLWIYRSNKKCLFSRNLGLIRLKNNSEIYPETLLFYLWGSDPQQLLNLIATGGTNGQITLSMAELREFPVPFFSKEFQDKLRDIFNSNEKLVKKSEDIYQEVQNLLLSELGLLNWKPKHRLSFIKNFSDTQSARRIDAEYFQPRYDEVVERIRQYKNGYKPLGEIIGVKDNTFQPKDDVAYRYIELANIAANGNINGFIEAQGKELPARARRKVNAGDVIVSTIEGSLLSIALIRDDLDNALCSTGFFVVNSEKINSETLLVLLKSLIGQLQLKKGCSGTILTAIGDDEFKGIILPDLPVGIQNDIKKKIMEMYNAKALSKRLLDIAKRGVEMAIEKNEKEAQNWIDMELKKLNVRLD